MTKISKAIATLVFCAGFSGGISGCLGSKLPYDRAGTKKENLIEPSPTPTALNAEGGIPGNGTSHSPGSGTTGTGSANLNFLSGTVTLSDGSALDFSTLKSKPLLLLFASEFCNVCKAEHDKLIASLAHSEQEPNYLKIVTLVVAMIPEDADSWKKDRSIPWTVGVDESLEWIDRICENRQTPCVLIQTPDRGIVFKRRGEVSPEEIKKWTGGWYE